VAVSLTGVEPARVLPGARLALVGRDLPLSNADLTSITMAGVPARVVFASATRIVIEVPPGLEGGPTEIKPAWSPGVTLIASVGRLIATGLHQVDNPVFDASGRLYVTYSGSRGQDVPVSIFRVTTADAREPFVSGLSNPTSMTIGPDGRLYVSSRFDGAIYRVFDDGRFESVATDLGVACGLAFGADDALFVGDRSGTIFRIDRTRVSRLATLPPSVAAFHLAMGADEGLYISGPTMAPRDPIYRVDMDGRVETLDISFGRPQGLAFDAHGVLHIVEALAGHAGVYRWRPPRAPELVVAGPNVIGVAFAHDGTMVVATSDSVFRFASTK
jgi:sugar lactone lactonase YvrE